MKATRDSSLIPKAPRRSIDRPLRVERCHRGGSETEERYDVYAPLVDLSELPGDRIFPYILPNGERASRQGDAIKWCAKHSGRCVQTIYRKLSKLRKDGSKALSPRPRKDKGSSRFFSQNHKAAVFVAYLHLALQPTARAIHGAIVRNRELLGISEAQLPSYETVRVWLRSALPALVKLALEGQRAYRELMFSDLERGLLAASKDRSE
jgi:hypothetical protein